MPVKRPESFNFGGVDSRSNPANFPAERLLRCKNFTPLPSGQLRLRSGYSEPSMSTISNGTVVEDMIGDSTNGTIQFGTPLNSAAYYEQWSGSQFILFSQNTNPTANPQAQDVLNQLNLATGAVTNVLGYVPPIPGGHATPFYGNPWGHFRANNRIFIGGGNFVVTPMVSWDGSTVRPVGIPDLASLYGAGAVSAVTAAATNATGSFATTMSSLATPGYQFYAVIFNPNTGHVGNRVAIGSRVPMNTTGESIILSNLPNPAYQHLTEVGYSEWILGIGRTNDGGQVPYWLTPTSGNGARLTVANSPSTVTTLNPVIITDPTIDATQELPYRNGLPISGLNKFAKVGSKIFGARPNDINLYYTEDDTDIANGNFVGVPAESWAGDNVEPYPTAEVPQAIHAYQFELHAFSKNYLSIWSLYMYQQGQNPWRGPWNVGCVGQRAWVETPYGPHWLTNDKQLFGWTGSAPIPVSEEYEAGLLQKIGDAYVGSTELAYHRNAELGIDRLYIKAQDVNGNPLFFVHDFKLRDMRNQIAQGYEFIYSVITPFTFVGAGYTPRQNLRDVNGRERLWTGGFDGRFYQLEDGSNSDNGTVYTGDAIALITAGAEKPLLSAIEWQGDGNVSVSFSAEASLGLADFTAAETKAVEVDNPDNRYQAAINQECRWVYARFQLAAHPADGNFAITDPPHVPMDTYGVINMATPKFGRGRPEAA